MKIIILRRLWRTASLITGFAVIGMVALGFMGYDLAGWQAKVDRSNAVRVSKPVLQEAMIPAISPDFFTEYRIEREKIRSERSDLLRDAIKNAPTEDARQKAQEAILKMMLEKQREAEMENLIRARGFMDALVFTRNNSVSVVVKASSLTREEVIQIADVVSRLAGVKPENITVSARP
ncbi:Hypothetical protein LUCI_3280 [Lucifera butyrica]|uniref:SpoIIIAH-like family protein n=1 Tax=Lucifera butyrica TaxID=1351585 RepID=A0A498RAL4_9FIRM|nr:SpoIIIAH-like family protein [Lucifera butyrica]VBB08015.1 Hypothetical protein LUCI_3280 [Lucifera butyrica]